MPNTSTTTCNPQDGNYRYVAERRQYGGLLLMTGFCAVIQPLARITTAVGPNGPLVTDVGDVAFWQFVGACCVLAIGLCSMLVGFIELLMDRSGEVTQHTLLIGLTQTAWILYIADMTAVGLTMVQDPPQFFLPFPNDTTETSLANQQKLNESTEVIFIGSCGIAGIFSYGFAFIGSIAFMQFALYTFRQGRPHHRDADYFRGRLGVYSSLLFIAGLCQILLGSFATELNLQNGRIQGGLIRVAMFVVHFPYITIVVGVLQFLNGFWGFCRAFYIGVGGRDDNWFQYSMAFLWIVVITFQDVVQISYLPEGMLAPTAPTLAAMSFGIIFMPAYLDYKMRNTPVRMDDNYYFGQVVPSPKDDEKPMLVRAIPNTFGGGSGPMRKVYVMEKPGYYQDDLEDDYFYNADDDDHVVDVVEPGYIPNSPAAHEEVTPAAPEEAPPIEEKTADEPINNAMDDEEAPTNNPNY
ncbi:expressed unknown protein [Seminavis robusta]|uniref:Uncharacterized protein n=1 Tax=Seminavis robusta TaxID=568900 RepID=A0A9N8E4H8_9STRA|nr:expressed unknown protein [Seminavis robusta]|eukprot:Sro641_g180070.1 n/a (466) ;mRNA; f:47706-49195